MQEKDKKSEDKKIEDKNDEIFHELMGAMERTIDERISNLTDEETKYVKLYGEHIKYYLLQGCIVNDTLFFNCGPEGINSPYEHFTRPLRYIDFEEVNRYFEENNISPDNKDWTDFEKSIDENAEMICPIYEEEEIRYLSYFRYESGEYCYYDIQEKKLYETGLVYEMSFRDENREVVSASEDYLIMQMNKGSIGSNQANSIVFDIIYNPESKCFGLLLGHDIIYDIDWLKDYTDYREDKDVENSRKLITRYRRGEIKDKEFLSLGTKRLDSMIWFIRNSVDGEIKAPKGLIDEMFEDYMDLFDRVKDVALNKVEK